MEKNKKITFNLYRYQILPTVQDIQLDFLKQEISSLEDLKRRKNELLNTILDKKETFCYHRAETITKKASVVDTVYIFKIGAKRSLKHTTKDFVEEQIDDWPFSFVIINNDPQIQKIAIQHNAKVFQKTATIRKIFEKNLNDGLSHYQLSLILEEIFEKKVFWDIVEKNKNKIVEAEFELISPNMSNISGGLKFDLAQLHKNTNTQKTDLKLKSDKNACLTLSQNDDFINSLVNYSSDGGGNIKLKIRGLKKKIQTSNNVKSITIDEIELENINKDNIKDIFEELFK